MSRAVQDDFGGFSPRFPGVSVRLTSQAEFDVLDRFIGDQPDADDGMDAFTAMSIRSVIEHEVRHYHDFLLSPYGSVVYRSKLQAAVAGESILHLLREAPGGWLPIPLGTWAKLPQDERTAYEAEWRDALAGAATPFRLVDIPFVPDDSTGGLKPGPLRAADGGTDLATLLRLAGRGHAKVRELTGGIIGLPGGSELQPHNFFEVLGLATQMQAIWNAQGAAAADIFLRFLMDSELSYARLWRRTLALAHRLGPVEGLGVLDQGSMIACWCILGNYAADGVKAAPNLRFELLEDRALAGAPDVAFAADTGQSWDRWDTMLGGLPWRQSLARASASNEEMLTTYSAAASESELGASLARLLERFNRDQKLAIDLVLQRPECLGQVSRYLQVEIPGELPMPLCRFDLVGFTMTPTRHSAFYPLWDRGFDTPVSQVVLREHGADFAQRVNDAVLIERVMRLTELALDNAEPSLSFEQNALEDLRLWTGKKPLWVV